jgi:hypothetical protein
VILAAGLVLRVGLAWGVFAGRGCTTDLSLFEEWASALAGSGPGSFYATAGSANYPPGYLYVLWLVGSLGAPVGALFGLSPDQGIGRSSGARARNVHGVHRHCELQFSLKASVQLPLRSGLAGVHASMPA